MRTSYLLAVLLAFGVLLPDLPTSPEARVQAAASSSQRDPVKPVPWGKPGSA